MTHYEILAALRAAGCALRFDRSGQIFLTGPVAPDEALHAAFSAQRAAVADLLVRERLQPWRPGICVVMAELMEIVAFLGSFGGAIDFIFNPREAELGAPVQSRTSSPSLRCAAACASAPSCRSGRAGG